MSITTGGTFRRSGGIVSAIGKQLKFVNLKAIQRITFKFDPFAEDVKSTRELLFYLTAPKVAQTNPNCIVKTEVVCDRQPSEVKFTLNNIGKEQLKVKEVKFLSGNLNALELLQQLNKHISVLAPKEELTSTAVKDKKIEKKKFGKK